MLITKGAHKHLWTGHNRLTYLLDCPAGRRSCLFVNEGISDELLIEAIAEMVLWRDTVMCLSLGSERTSIKWLKDEATQ